MNYEKVLDNIFELSISLDCSAKEIIELMTGILISEEDTFTLYELMKK